MKKPVFFFFFFFCKILNGISNTFTKWFFSFFETGARVSEALAVKLIDIDFKK